MVRFLLCLFGVVLSLCLQKANGHTYSLGNCPHIDPLPGFNMNRMCGIWYVIQKTSTASSCIAYNFTKLDEPDHYVLQQTSQHFLLGLTPLNHEYYYTGHLKVEDRSVPARMRVKFPLNPLGCASYTVFMTDYDNYAAAFTCQYLGFGHRRSVSILSRSKTLDKVLIDKARTKLASYNIDSSDLSIISQKDCTNESHGININIDPHTFSAESGAEEVHTAGDITGDGVQFVAGGAKNGYTTFTENVDKVRGSGGKIKNDAEMVITSHAHGGSNAGNFNTGSSVHTAGSNSSQENNGVVDETSADAWIP